MKAIRAMFFMLMFIISAATSVVNDRPIIGILTQQTQMNIPGLIGTSYINADYVGYIESAGGRVVPIHNNISAEELEKIFKYINGVILPGGDSDLSNSGYQRNAEMIVKLAMDAFDNGDYFPVWGTCLGLQSLAVTVENSCSVLTKSKGTWDQSMSLEFNQNISHSKMLGSAPSHIISILKSGNVTYNAHYNCVSVETYQNSGLLRSFFNILSTNKDSHGKVFISTWEGYRYPLYAVQWHPEMNMFSFNVAEGLGQNINHSKEAIEVSQYFANFFVSETRKSSHRFPNKASEEDWLIYKYTPFHCGPLGFFPEQVYIF